MYELFTDSAANILKSANREAQRFGHEYISAEHILLGLIEQNTGGCTALFEALGLDASGIRREVETSLSSRGNLDDGNDIPISRAKTVVEHSMEEARSLKHQYVGTEHFLLGVLRQHDCEAAKILSAHGVTLDNVRAEAIRLGSARPDKPRIVPAHPDEVAQYQQDASVRSLTASLEQLQLEKEDAVRNGEWDRATSIRDQQSRVRAELNQRIEQLRREDS